ncbi:MAG: hypothetical protein AB7K24_18575 [Gemmataceae bacterium]
MKYRPGERVLMLQHGNWRQPVCGRVQGNGRVRPDAAGQYHVEYFIRFDRLQTARQFLGTSVREEHLQPLARP